MHANIRTGTHSTSVCMRTYTIQSIYFNEFPSQNEWRVRNIPLNYGPGWDELPPPLLPSLLLAAATFIWILLFLLLFSFFYSVNVWLFVAVFLFRSFAVWFSLKSSTKPHICLAHGCCTHSKYNIYMFERMNERTNMARTSLLNEWVCVCVCVCKSMC